MAYFLNPDPRQNPIRIGGPFQFGGGQYGDPDFSKQKQPGAPSPTGPIDPRLQQPSPTKTLGAQSVRAIGQNFGQPSWAQNLATFAGGQYAGRGTNRLNVNPFSTNPLPDNLQTLFMQAVGGNPFSFTAPAQPTKPHWNIPFPWDRGGGKFGQMDTR